MSRRNKESDPLLSRRRDSAADRVESGRNKKKERGAVVTGRFTTVLFLVVLVFVGIAYQIEVNQLQTLLATEQAKVQKLELVVEKHDGVISRFNSSVTNTDVMTRLASLEQGLDSSKKDLREELSTVQKEVDMELSETLQTLNVTVSNAEAEIRDEVARVKKDVEQYVVATQDQFSMENSFMVYQLAGTFTLLSCLISMWHMTAHIRRMNQPDVQRKILAILWMVPVYAITSWFSLVFPSVQGYLAIIKDGYEAYVIYQFLSFCISVLGKGDRDTVIDLLSRRADHLTPPFRLKSVFEVCGLITPVEYESDRALASAILLQCQFFAMQFVFFRPLTTTAMVVLKKMDYYGAGDGPTDYRSPQFYITIIQNLSIFTAFTGLLKFYHAVDKDLAWCRPFAKFLCIKCVVFMTFWQGLVISVLGSTTDVGGQDADEWATSAQDFLICLEMLLFAIAHFYCFPTEEWEDGYRVKQAEGKFGDSMALQDFFSDIKLILRSNQQTQRKKKKKRKAAPPSIPEEQIEEQDSDSQSTASANESFADTEASAYSMDTSDAFHTPDKRSRHLEDHRLADALEECLGLAADDPDIVEAKQRLIASNILSPDLFVSRDDIDDEDIDEKIVAYLDEQADLEGEVDTDELDRKISAYLGEQAGPDEEAAFSEYEGPGGIYSNVRYTDGTEPLENAPLLGSSPAYKLKPSIFTTVAQIAETESDDEFDFQPRQLDPSVIADNLGTEIGEIVEVQEEKQGNESDQDDVEVGSSAQEQKKDPGDWAERE